MKETRIFILIPVYNVEQYLDACLGSILSQDYSEYEVILVDDGSKDSSGEICDRYAADNQHIHVVHKENGGQLSARFAAIEYIYQNCEYENTYSIFVDSDDELKAGALKIINQRIAASGCDMLIYGYEKFDDNGIIYTTLEEKTDEELIDNIGELFREAVIEHSFNSLCRKAVRTEMLSFEMGENIKSLKMGEDLIQSIFIYKQNPITFIVPDIIYRYRTNPNSVTQTFKLKLFTDELSSRYCLVKAVEELRIWHDDDFNKYFQKSLSVLKWDIVQLLNKSSSRKEALNNLKHLYQHTFVQEYCLKRITKKSNIRLREFSKGHFKILWFLHKISLIKNAGKEKKKIGRKQGA